MQAVDRAVALLQAVAALPPARATLSELADRCGINRSTAWRLLATLEDGGMVERRGGGYALGLAAAQMAGAASMDALMRRAHPVLARVANTSGETASLAVARRFGLHYVDQAVSTDIVSESWLGRPVPLHATSTGKAYLAWLGDAEVDDYLAGPLPAFTPHTITDPEALRVELQATRQRGFATCMEELTRTAGVAAPILDGRGRPIGAIDIWGPPERVSTARLGALGQLVREAAAEIATLLDPP